MEWIWGGGAGAAAVEEGCGEERVPRGEGAGARMRAEQEEVAREMRRGRACMLRSSLR